MTELNRETLKDKQKEAICSFVNGRDWLCYVRVQVRMARSNVMDQVNTICWSSQEDPSVTRGVLHGGYQLVFMSPEALIGCKHWQEMLLTRKYKDDLVALVVDEAHCVKTWSFLTSSNFL